MDVAIDQHLKQVHDESQRRLLQESGDTALHISAAAGGLNDAARFECLEMLIGLGASLDLPNKASSCRPDRFMCRIGRADLATRNTCQGAILAQKSSRTEECHTALALCLQDGRVPLHVAAMSGNLKAVQRLLAAGARRTVPDKVCAHCSRLLIGSYAPSSLLHTEPAVTYSGHACARCAGSVCRLYSGSEWSIIICLR